MQEEMGSDARLTTITEYRPGEDSVPGMYSVWSSSAVSRCATQLVRPQLDPEPRLEFTLFVLTSRRILACMGSPFDSSESWNHNPLTSSGSQFRNVGSCPATRLPSWMSGVAIGLLADIMQVHIEHRVGSDDDAVTVSWRREGSEMPSDEVAE